MQLHTYNNPKSHIAEAYRILRTNIEFSNIDKNIKTILVTSAQQNEGKSTSISNLARNQKKAFINNGRLMLENEDVNFRGTLVKEKKFLGIF